jgi:putative transposase
VQYTSLTFSEKLEDEGFLPSIGWVGCAYDNALAASFVATLKTAFLYRNPRPARKAARNACFEYVEDSYNTRRRPPR